MKPILLFIWRVMLCIMSLSLCSCEILDYLMQEIIEPESGLTINTGTEVSVAPEGQSVEVGFTSALPWTVEFDYSSSDEWITSSKSAGQQGEILLMVTAEANDTGEERTATMTIFSGDLFARVTFVQSYIPSDKDDEKEPFFNILSQNAMLGHEGGLVEVLLSTNTEYSISISYDWLREIHSEGTVNITHVFEVDPNADTENRVANIIFCSGQYCYPYSIIQEGAPKEDVSDTEDINKGDDINMR